MKISNNKQYYNYLKQKHDKPYVKWQIGHDGKTEESFENVFRSIVKQRELINEFRK